MGLQEISNMVYIRLPNESHARILGPPPSVSSIGTLIPYLHRRFALSHPENHYNVYYRDGLVDHDCSLSGFSLDRVLTLRLTPAPLCQLESVALKDQPSQPLSPSSTASSGAISLPSKDAGLPKSEQKTCHALDLQSNLPRPHLDQTSKLVPSTLNQSNSISGDKSQSNGISPTSNIVTENTKDQKVPTAVKPKLSPTARYRRNKRNRLREKRRRLEAKIGLDRTKTLKGPVPCNLSNDTCSQIVNEEQGGNGCKDDKVNSEELTLTKGCQKSPTFSQELLLCLEDVESALKMPTDRISLPRLTVARMMYFLRSMTRSPSSAPGSVPGSTPTTNNEGNNQTSNGNSHISRINNANEVQVSSSVNYTLEDELKDTKVEPDQRAGHQRLETQNSALRKPGKKRKAYHTDNAKPNKIARNYISEYFNADASASKMSEGKNGCGIGNDTNPHRLPHVPYKKLDSPSSKIVPMKPVPTDMQQEVLSPKASDSVQILTENSRSSHLESTRNAALHELLLETEQGPLEVSNEKACSKQKNVEDFQILESERDLTNASNAIEMNETKCKSSTQTCATEQKEGLVLVNDESKEAGNELMLNKDFTAAQPKSKPVSTFAGTAGRYERPTMVNLLPTVPRSFATTEPSNKLARIKKPRQGTISDVLAMARRRGILPTNYSQDDIHLSKGNKPGLERPTNGSSNSWVKTNSVKNTDSCRDMQKVCSSPRNKRTIELQHGISAVKNQVVRPKGTKEPQSSLSRTDQNVGVLQDQQESHGNLNKQFDNSSASEDLFEKDRLWNDNLSASEDPFEKDLRWNVVDDIVPVHQDQQRSSRDSDKRSDFASYDGGDPFDNHSDFRGRDDDDPKNTNQDLNIQTGIGPSTTEQEKDNIKNGTQHRAKRGNFKCVEISRENVELTSKEFDDMTCNYVENDATKRNQDCSDKQNNFEVVKEEPARELHSAGISDNSNDGEGYHDEKSNVKHSHSKMDSAHHYKDFFIEQDFTNSIQKEEPPADKYNVAERQTPGLKFRRAEISRRDAETEPQHNYSTLLRDARQLHGSADQ